MRLRWFRLLCLLSVVAAASAVAVVSTPRKLDAEVRHRTAVRVAATAPTAARPTPTVAPTPTPSATPSATPEAEPTPASLDPYDYPWPRQNKKNTLVDGHGYYAAECTSFAAWAIRSDGRHHERSPDFLGNADQWTGAAVDPTPHVGDVAQWDPNTSRSLALGHVAYVADVSDDGTVEIYEYNWGRAHGLTIARVAAAGVSRFLRF